MKGLINEKLPTLLFIFGGGYQVGAAQSYGPDYLLNQNVIVVSDTILISSNYEQSNKGLITILGYI